MGKNKQNKRRKYPERCDSPQEPRAAESSRTGAIPQQQQQQQQQAAAAPATALVNAISTFANPLDPIAVRAAIANSPQAQPVLRPPTPGMTPVLTVRRAPTTPPTPPTTPGAGARAASNRAARRRAETHRRPRGNLQVAHPVERRLTEMQAREAAWARYVEAHEARARARGGAVNRRMEVAARWWRGWTVRGAVRRARYVFFFSTAPTLVSLGPDMKGIKKVVDRPCGEGCCIL